MENTILSNNPVELDNTKSNLLSKIVYFVKFMLKILVNFCLIVLFLLTCFVALVFVDDEINKARGIDVPPIVSAYVIVSPSMTPTIKVQDAVLVFRSSNYQVGDIITFRSTDSRYSGYTITHRINDVITANNGKVMYITKGDNNSIPDSAPVYQENIYGKVALKIPYLGFIQNVLFNPVVLFLILLIPSIIFVTYNIVLYFKTIKQNNKEELNENVENLLDNETNSNIIDEKKEEIEIL